MEDSKIISENVDISTDGMSLVRDENGLSLAWNGMILRGDFTDMIPRIRPGRLESELIVKASGILKNKGGAGGSDRGSGTACLDCSVSHAPLAIDATAGLGEDSLLLAAAGFRVKIYEKDAIVFYLLKDAVERALALPDYEEYAVLKSAVSRMEIFNDDSIKAMDEKPDVIFLDPMFPERRKSSLVGKKLQMLQQIEKPCDNEEELLDAAFAASPKRIIIKRPPKGPYLGGIKPTFSLGGKSVRIDCIVL